MSKIKTVLKIALPAVLEMFLYMLIWVIDTAFVGNYGGQVAVSAVGFGSEIIYTIIGVFIFMGVNTGITALVAQSIGAGKKDAAEEFLVQGLLIGLVLAIAISLFLAFFSYQLLEMAGMEGEVLYYANIYMKIVSVGVFFNILASMLNAGLRGTGNTFIPLLSAICMNIIAIFLDWVLIFGKLGFEPMGVAGSAYATVLSYLVGFVFITLYYAKYSDFKVRVKYLKKINREYLGRIVKLAVPSALQEGVFNSSRILTSIFIISLGSTAFAASQITIAIESISFMPGWGFAVAATTLVGQQIGAQNYKTAKEYGYLCMLFGTVIMIICAVAFITVPELLMKLFIKEADTIAVGRLCLMVAAIEQPFMAIAMALEGAIKGSGDTKTPFIVAVISNWVIRIPLMYYLVYIVELGVAYVWGAMVIQWIFEGLTMLYIFHRKTRHWSAKDFNGHLSLVSEAP